MPAPKGHPPYPGCETGGRPLRFTNDFIEKMAQELETWIQEKDNIFIERFCLLHDFPEEKITVFVSNEKFNKAYTKLKSKQKVALFEGSLKKKYAHPMCALILGHNHGIYAKTEQTISGNASNPINILFNDITDTSKDLIDDPDRPAT